ncbi:MAG: 3-isopropylmalate dehydratase small subunit [Candidatus Obscuribacterales bacterium]|nr:3-isopropylmalate dehydratase small subunit [Candidatus Obscuribacterales bacterium]
MKKFTQLKSKSIPLPVKDVDTDMIIPAQFLTSISSEGYGQNLFRRLRDNDANFPLNQDKFKGASLLVADHNFGCGSSREHAVWALTGWGISVVIAKSFADIFYNNSAKTGLLLITLPEKVVDRLLSEAQSSDLELTVNLEEQCVEHPSGESFRFEYDPFRKHCILNGLDDIDYILSHKQEIAAFRDKQTDSGLVAVSTTAK